MPDPAPDRPEPLEFLRLLWSLDHALQATSKRMLARYGVTGPQRSAVRFVGRTPGITAGALAEALQHHPSTTTGILRRLVDHGLVHREVHPTDRRKAVLTLTAAGRRLEATTAGTVEAGVLRAFDRLGEDEVRVARRVLDVLLASIVEERDGGGAPSGRG